MSASTRTAIVTGGAVRIGRAIALGLAQDGINVCVHFGQSAEAAVEVVREIEALGVSALGVPADFRDPVNASRKLLQLATEKLGPIKFLINSAAIFEPGTLASTSEEEWDGHFDINLKAPFFLSQAFANQAPDGSCLINILDWRGTNPVPGHMAYTMTKAAMVAQTKLLAQELGPRIRVNGIAPGAILPPVGTGEAALKLRASYNPLLRTGCPDDIVRTVRYLLASPFVTGEIIHVSGGEQLAVGQKYSPSPE